MSFTVLPHETITNILAFTEPLDIRRCQQVCRLFHNLVKRDMRLQYILELDACGYTMPRVPRYELSYTDKVEALRKRRATWRQTVLSQSLFAPLLPRHIHMFQFADGVFACGYRDEGSDQDFTHDSTRLIRFDQLPSSNRGTEHKFWQHELEFNVVSFAIHPEQDLLVLLQPLEHMDDFLRENYKVHVLTMSTCKPHPAAMPSNSMALNLQLATDELDPFGTRSDFALQICHSVVAVKVGGKRSGLVPCLVIWEWVSGQQLAFIATPESAGEEPWFCFISEDYIAVPRSADPTKGKFTNLGRLDIYHIPRTGCSIPPQSRDRVTSLELPKFQKPQHLSYMEIHSAPMSVTIYGHLEGNSLAKIYEPTREGYMRLDYHAFRRTGRVQSADGVRRYGSLVVLSTMLLDVMDGHLAGGSSLDKNSGAATLIPWESWRHCTCDIDRDEPIWNQISISSQGLSFLEYPPLESDSSPCVIFLDYSARRLRVQGSGGFSLAGEHSLDHVPPNGRIGLKGDQYVLEETFVGTNPNVLSYIQRSLKVPEPLGTALWSKLRDMMVDDEHVLVVVTDTDDAGYDTGLKRGLYAYAI